MTNLQKMRIHRNLTQADLAAQAKMNIRSLQYYEQGRKDLAHVRIDKLLRLCIVLDCKLSDIIEDAQCKILYNEYEKCKTSESYDKEDEDEYEEDEDEEGAE